MAGEDRQDIARLRVRALRLGRVAADDEQVVDPGGGRALEHGLEVRAVAEHPHREVHRDPVAERPEALGHVERVIDPVPGRGGDREAHRSRQLGRLGLALGEGHDLVAQHGAGGDQTAAAERQSPSYSLRTVSA
jgi:hypothetical protein